MAVYKMSACLDCGKERKVQFRGDKPISLRCHPCGAKHRAASQPLSWNNREGHPRWKGGRHITSDGYVQIVVDLDDPLLVMADDRGRVYEHRLVVARSLGRPLLSTEIVHHRNGNKQDNRGENLTLTSREEHSAEHHREIATLRARVQELEREVARLQAEAP